MKMNELYNKLMTAYSDRNLHKITITLINMYRNKQFGSLEHIAEIISDVVAITIDPDVKYFSKLMMLYHPDRGQYHRMEIKSLAEQNDYKGLVNYSHILLLEKIDEIAISLSTIEDIDYSPVYEWEWDADGFHIVGDEASSNVMEKDERSVQSSHGISFYEAFQLRMIGNTSTGFPSYYFEDIEELELAQSGINDLSGIQYCIHVKAVDLSSNAISDISNMWELSQLEDLDLSDNRLELVDCLSNLQNLRNINLSDNRITDIAPLLLLNKLEYVVLSGNRISRSQILKLEERGITVVSD